jgi:hypothetical protein
MEPCFNPALEIQAVGRVYRLGQKRSVEIVRLVMEDSVEMRIREMLAKKYGSSDVAIEDDEPPAVVAKPGALVGSIRSDKAVVMEEEFDLLFGVENLASSGEEEDFPLPDNAASSDGTTGFV